MSYIMPVYHESSSIFRLREQQTSKQQASTDGRMVDGRPDQETQKRGMIHSGAQWSMEIREAGRKPGYASDDEEGLAG